MKNLFEKIDNFFDKLSTVLIIIVFILLAAYLDQEYKKNIIKEAITEMKGEK